MNGIDPGLTPGISGIDPGLDPGGIDGPPPAPSPVQPEEPSVIVERKPQQKEPLSRGSSQGESDPEMSGSISSTSGTAGRNPREATSVRIGRMVRKRLSPIQFVRLITAWIILHIRIPLGREWAYETLFKLAKERASYVCSDFENRVYEAVKHNDKRNRVDTRGKHKGATVEQVKDSLRYEYKADYTDEELRTALDTLENEKILAIESGRYYVADTVISLPW